MLRFATCPQSLASLAACSSSSFFRGLKQAGMTGFAGFLAVDESIFAWTKTQSGFWEVCPRLWYDSCSFQPIAGKGGRYVR